MAVIQWNQIKPDFSSSNRSMQNAMSGLSNAGTVFDKLRQSILDEEQRALENAYRQQTFDENVRQFELQQALEKEKFDEDIRQFNTDWENKREESRLDREHDIGLEATKHNNRKKEITLQGEIDADLAKKQHDWDIIKIGKQSDADIALAQAKITAESKDKTEDAALHGASRSLLDTLLAKGYSLSEASKIIETQFAQLSNGRYEFDGTRVYTPEQQAELSIIRSPRNKAQQDYSNRIEAATRITDADGARLLLDPNSRFANPNLIDLTNRLRTVDGEVFVLDRSTGKPRALTAEENTLYQQYVGNNEREVDTYNFLNSTDIDPDEARTIAKQTQSAIGLRTFRDNLANTYGVDPELIGDKSITANAKTAEERKNAIEKAVTDLEIANKKDLNLPAYTEKLVKYAGQTITVGKGKDESTKRLVSQEYQGAAAAMAKMFMEYGVPASQMDLMLSRMHSKEEEDANSYIRSDPMEVAKKYGEAVINSYLESQGKPTITLDVKDGKFVDAVKAQAEEEQQKKLEAAEAEGTLKDERKKIEDLGPDRVLQAVYNDVDSREAALKSVDSTETFSPFSVTYTPGYKEKKQKEIEEIKAVADALKDNKSVDFASEYALKEVYKTIQSAMIRVGTGPQTQRFTKEQDEQTSRWLKLVETAIKAKK